MVNFSADNEEHDRKQELVCNRVNIYIFVHM